MKLKYHGLFITSETTGIYRFGIENLISGPAIFRWIGVPDLSEIEKDTLKRFDKDRYSQCVTKSRNIAFKLEQAIRKLSENIKIFENSDQYFLEGAKVDDVAPFLNSSGEIDYHLDSLFSYLRIFADIVSYTIPHFYENTGGNSISNRSFREHRKWYFKNPDFDPEYLTLLEQRTIWFDKIAGKDPQGIRDINTHHFGTYQLGTKIFPDGKQNIVIHHVSPDGVIDDDLQFTIEEILLDFFYFLDGVYELFYERIIKQLPLLSTKPIDEFSILMGMTTINPIDQKYRLLPVVNKKN